MEKFFRQFNSWLPEDRMLACVGNAWVNCLEPSNGASAPGRTISAEKQTLTISQKRWCYAFWLLVISGFALLHTLHLTADFPNHTPWFMDWAKYTDEGWYGNAAVRAHLFGNWYQPGDFNPAPAVPVWPFLEWVLFFFTGVSIQAARGLAVAFFFCNLLLSYLLLRTRGPRWMGLLALTLIVTSPFLYCFSRLAILEPMLIAFTLAALNLAVRLPRWRRPVAASIVIGLLFTLMMLTKTTAVFLLPALGWAMLAPLGCNRKLALRSVLAAAGSFAASFGLWITLVIQSGHLADYRYLFFVNKYIKPKEFYWPLVSFWWSFHGGLWVDHILIPLAGLITLGAILASFAPHPTLARWKSAARSLLADPVFGASILAAAGYILFMTYQDHPQPRYFAVVAFFCFFIVAQGANALISAWPVQESEPSLAAEGGEVVNKFSPERTSGVEAEHSSGTEAGHSAGAEAPTGCARSNDSACSAEGVKPSSCPFRHCAPVFGWAVVALAMLAAISNGLQTLNYAAHPEYTFVDAAQRLTRYIDAHPNGKRLLVSISGDQITLVTHLPSLCDDFGTQELVSKLADAQPGWYAAWNDLDPGTIEDIHTHFSLEQVASFRTFDDPERNVLVLFKLHPLPGGQVREPAKQNLQIPLPGDTININIQ